MSAAWKALSEEERFPWVQMSVLDKIRFQYEMAHYKGPLRVAKSTRKKKDPDAPKRPVSAFLAYSHAKGHEIRKENPTMKAAELAISLAKMWKADHPSVREQFTNLSQTYYENYRAQTALHKKIKVTEKQQKENEAVIKALSERQSSLEAFTQRDVLCPNLPAKYFDEECSRDFWEPLPFFEINDIELDMLLDVNTTQPSFGASALPNVHNPCAVWAKEDGPFPTAFGQRCGPVFRNADIVGDAQIVTPEQSPRDVFLQPQQLIDAVTTCTVTPEKSSKVPASVSGYLRIGSSSNNNYHVGVSRSELPAVSLAPPSRYGGVDPFLFLHLPFPPDLTRAPTLDNTTPSCFMAESGGNKTM